MLIGVVAVRGHVSELCSQILLIMRFGTIELRDARSVGRSIGWSVVLLLFRGRVDKAVVGRQVRLLVIRSV